MVNEQILKTSLRGQRMTTMSCNTRKKWLKKRQNILNTLSWENKTTSNISCLSTDDNFYKRSSLSFNWGNLIKLHFAAENQRVGKTGNAPLTFFTGKNSEVIKGLGHPQVWVVVKVRGHLLWGGAHRAGTELWNCPLHWTHSD